VPSLAAQSASRCPSPEDLQDLSLPRVFIQPIARANLVTFWKVNRDFRGNLGKGLRFAGVNISVRIWAGNASTNDRSLSHQHQKKGLDSFRIEYHQRQQAILSG
jgi:hypothetical protein